MVRVAPHVQLARPVAALAADRVPLEHRWREAVRVLRMLVQLVRVTITIARHLRSWDILYLFMPGYPSSIAYLLNLVVHRPYFVYLADDWVQASPALFRWRGRRLLYGLFFRLNSLLQRRVVKDSLMIVTAGKDLYEKYRDLDKPIYETVPRMTLRAEDIVRRDDTCLREPIRLVYVGDLIGYKGVEYLIRAVALLGERSTHRYVLSIVGAGPLSEELRARAAEWPLDCKWAPSETDISARLPRRGRQTASAAAHRRSK